MRFYCINIRWFRAKLICLTPEAYMQQPRQANPDVICPGHRQPILLRPSQLQQLCSVVIFECVGESSFRISQYTTSFSFARISPYAYDHGHSHRATCHPPLDCSPHIPCNIITRIFVLYNLSNSTPFQGFVRLFPTACKPSGAIPGYRPALIRKPRQLLRPKK